MPINIPFKTVLNGRKFQNGKWCWRDAAKPQKKLSVFLLDSFIQTKNGRTFRKSYKTRVTRLSLVNHQIILHVIGKIFQNTFFFIKCQ